jgi:hypothetical protein
VEQKEPDVQVHPLRKFCRLALQGNPNILEILFASGGYWHEDQDDAFFVPFLDNRHKFLSQRVRQTHVGYAMSQLSRVVDGKSPASQSRKELMNEFGYDTKYAMHTARLLIQGQNILIEKDFNPTLWGGDLEMLKGILAGEWDKQEFIEWAQDKITYVEELVSDLPQEPDTKFIEELLIKTYRKHL